MKQVTYEIDIAKGAPFVYDYLRHVDSWASMTPSYANHKHINAKESVWVMRGILPGRPLTAQVQFVKEQRPTIMTFVVNGISDQFNAQGQVVLTPIATGCRMFVQVKARAQGLSGAILNPLIATALPTVTKYLADKLATQIEQQHTL